jgi:3-hydroxyisobutyrate dehydrogenase-like beta-hydroxyacid dehydrogenase
MKIGLLHPGAMGSFLGGAVSAAGHRVIWASEGRSQATRDRAADLEDAGSLGDLVRVAEVILSVCPPENALEVAGAVSDAGFGGLYVDLNADSPHTVRAISRLLPSVVDGAIIGGPSPTSAVVHLAGPGAEEAAALFDRTIVSVRVVAGELGTASALKACYAASTKAVGALLLAVRAAAVESGVESQLLAEWERTMPGQVDQSDRSLATIGAKAWRFSGEMREAAEYFSSVGVPSGFSTAAAEVYERLADLRSEPHSPTDVIARLLK